MLPKLLKYIWYTDGIINKQIILNIWKYCCMLRLSPLRYSEKVARLLQKEPKPILTYNHRIIKIGKDL